MGWGGRGGFRSRIRHGSGPDPRPDPPNRLPLATYTGKGGCQKPRAEGQTPREQSLSPLKEGMFWVAPSCRRDVKKNPWSPPCPPSKHYLSSLRSQVSGARLGRSKGCEASKVWGYTGHKCPRDCDPGRLARGMGSFRFQGRAYTMSPKWDPKWLETGPKGMEGA